PCTVLGRLDTVPAAYALRVRGASCTQRQTAVDHSCRQTLADMGDITAGPLVTTATQPANRTGAHIGGCLTFADLSLRAVTCPERKGTTPTRSVLSERPRTCSAAAAGWPAAAAPRSGRSAASARSRSGGPGRT